MVNIFEQEVKQHVIKMTDNIVHFQQLLKTVMEVSASSFAEFTTDCS